MGRAVDDESATGDAVGVSANGRSEVMARRARVTVDAPESVYDTPPGAMSTRGNVRLQRRAVGED